MSNFRIRICTFIFSCDSLSWRLSFSFSLTVSSSNLELGLVVISLTGVCLFPWPDPDATEETLPEVCLLPSACELCKRLPTLSAVSVDIRICEQHKSSIFRYKFKVTLWQKMIPLSVWNHDDHQGLHGNLATELCWPQEPSPYYMHGFLCTSIDKAKHENANHKCTLFKLFVGILTSEAPVHKPFHIGFAGHCG